MNRGRWWCSADWNRSAKAERRDVSFALCGRFMYLEDRRLMVDPSLTTRLFGVARATGVACAAADYACEWAGAPLS